MKSCKTKGIVIKRINFGEADRILTILTERLGKIKAIAKGVRKTKSRLAGHLEPFMIIDLQLHEGKTFYIVTGATIVKDFPKIHDNLEKVSKCFYVGELVDKFLEENHKDREIFELFFAVLKCIEESDGNFWLRVFELKLIEASGFHPELYNCIHCQKKLEQENNFWDNIEGGVICLECQKKYHHGKKVSDQSIKFFRYIEKNDIEGIKKLKITQPIEKESEEVLESYIQSIIEREIKSLGFLKLVNKQS